MNCTVPDIWFHNIINNNNNNSHISPQHDQFISVKNISSNVNLYLTDLLLWLTRCWRVNVDGENRSEFRLRSLSSDLISIHGASPDWAARPPELNDPANWPFVSKDPEEPESQTLSEQAKWLQSMETRRKNRGYSQEQCFQGLDFESFSDCSQFCIWQKHQ